MWSLSVWWRDGFLRIFTLAFIPIPVLARVSNHVPILPNLFEEKKLWKWSKFNYFYTFACNINWRYDCSKRKICHIE